MIDITYDESCSELIIEEHFHNSYEIICVLEGMVLFHIGSRTYNIAPGNIVFVNNLENHRMKVLSSPYKRYFALIDPAWFQTAVNDPVLLSIFKNRPGHFNHAIQLDENAMKYVSGLFKRMMTETGEKKPYWELAVESGLKELLIFLYRNYRASFPVMAYTKSMETIFKVQKYIEENCSDEITLETVAKTFYMDKYYLSRLFKETTGFTFKEYLILQRISRAKERLFSTNDSIIKVGIDSGFNNVNHFIRIFKKYTGTSPLKYRLAYRSKDLGGV